MNKHLEVILDAKEAELDRFLPADVSTVFRDVVLEQFNDFLDVVLDVIDSLDNGTVTLNDHYLDLLEAIHVATVGPIQTSV